MHTTLGYIPSTTPAQLHKKGKVRPRQNGKISGLMLQYKFLNFIYLLALNYS
jgi:hypothetical protein